MRGALVAKTPVCRQFTPLVANRKTAVAGAPIRDLISPMDQ
jgi:hypothetical protein